MPRKITTKAKAAVKTLTEAASELAGTVKEQVSNAQAFIEVFPLARPVLLRYEGVHDGNPDTPLLEPQPDAVGWYTLGYGHLIIDRETGGRISHTPAGARRVKELYPVGITLEEAETLLQQDCYVRFIQLRSRPEYCALSYAQQASLLSFSYNIGVNALYKSTAWSMITAGDPKTEIEGDPADLYVHAVRKGAYSNLAQAFTAWVRATNARGLRIVLPGLFARRLAEFLIFTGTEATDAIEQADLVTRAAIRPAS